MAAKTGNSYTTGTTTQRRNSNGNPGFSTMASTNKVSPSDVG